MIVEIDEIIVNVLSSVISAAALRAGAAARSVLRGKSDGQELAYARWFEAYQPALVLPDMSVLSSDDKDDLGKALRGYEVQAVLHELLAARLTGAPQADIARIRSLWDSTMRTAGPIGTAATEALFDYYDTEISALVSGMKSQVPELLREIRSDAFNARIVSILNAIERHAASLSAAPARQTDEDFLIRYKQHVLDYHGKLEPPDFQRRRRVPFEKLHVAPTIYQVADADPRDPPVEISLRMLADRIDRTVLLGAPGGGKTTAANALLTFHAVGDRRRVPFLVTLRDFAVQDLSVVGYIEHQLRVFYQCAARAGLVEQLLLTGDALVIFDGLDELLDASRRVEAAAIVELFCAEYPLAPVLVTSRIVGYDQARLDDRQFSVYRLGDLSDEQVGEYVHKWFNQEEGIAPDEAERWATAFLDESATVADLRATPLMLSLMCILYRGEGSLPRNRAQVYEQCATVLYSRWDARRRINPSFRAGHLVEPSLRHLAWWMINLDGARTAVTEHELVNEATEFLHGRGFETREDARQAAEEFISFCRGRMWVLTEMGVTATGEPMYAFTHRTFLEYFAGEQLAYSSDTPDQLADVLVPRVVSGEWDMLGELAMQIKDRTSDEGARRLYEALMARCDDLPVAGRSAVLQFLARSLRSVEPPPATVRDLTAMVLDHLFAGNLDDQVHYLPLCWLMASSGLYNEIVSKDMNARIDAMIASTEPATRRNGLRLAIWGPYGITWFGDNGPQLDRQNPLALYWRQRRDDNVRDYAAPIVRAATDDASMRNTAIWSNLIGVDQALEMPGGIAALFRTWPTGIFGGQWGSELLSAARNLANGFLANGGPWMVVQVAQIAMLGEYFVEHEPPWITGSSVEIWPGFFATHSSNDGQPARPLSPMSYLGAAITLLIAAEVAGQRTPPAEGAQWLGPLSGLYPYLLRRWNLYPDGELPRLPVPDRFERLFYDWAAQRIDFVSP